MRVDIRIPIGAMFVIIGAFLVLAGFSTGDARVAGLSAEVIDVGWGAVLALFGAALLLLARGAARRAR